MSVKSCVTIALVPEIRYGPWVFWDDLEAGMEKAAKLGFDAAELFTASASAVPMDQVAALSDRLRLPVAAVGTGAGKVIRGLTLVDPDPAVRAEAVEFIKDMIGFGAALQAPAIIGSMQGVVLPGGDRPQALSWLAEGLTVLGAHARSYGVNLVYEPLNRYETNLFNRLGDAVEFLKTFDSKGVTLLADLFHMNIEEASIEAALREHAAYIGHVHFADSNRQPVGFGHTDMTGVAAALKDIGYDGYASAEALPVPDPDAAAAQTIKAFRQWFG